MKAMRIEIKAKSELEAESLAVAKAFDQGKRVKPVSGTYFESMQAVRKFLTDKRLEVWRTIRDRKPGSITELAKMLKRDFKSIHSDVMLLESIGLIKLKKHKGQRGDVQTPVALVSELILSVA
jgi:predicted transcriptional regulator